MPHPNHKLSEAEIRKMVREAHEIAATAKLSRLAALRAGLVPLMATTEEELVFIFRSAMRSGRR